MEFQTFGVVGTEVKMGGSMAGSRIVEFLAQQVILCHDFSGLVDSFQ